MYQQKIQLDYRNVFILRKVACISFTVLFLSFNFAAKRLIEQWIVKLIYQLVEEQKVLPSLPVASPKKPLRSLLVFRYVFVYLLLRCIENTTAHSKNVYAAHEISQSQAAC